MLCNVISNNSYVNAYNIYIRPSSCGMQYVPYVPVRQRKEAKYERREEQRRRERREYTPPPQPDAPKVGPKAKVSLLDQAAELQKEALGVHIWRT